MARPKKEGLDYFPLDVDIDQDDKIALVEAKYGAEGFAIVIKLLMRIYKHNYYYKWTETEQLLFSRRVNVDINRVNDCINDCIKWNMFDENQFKSFEILTSKGIQKRYLEAVGRRQKVEMIQEYLLLSTNYINAYKNLTLMRVNVNNNSVNDNINPQSKVKESKEKESKVNNNVADEIERSTIIHFYESNGFGTIGGYIAEKIHQWCDDLSPELVLESMKIAVENGAKKFKYCETILKDWYSKKLTTLEEVEANRLEYQERKSKQGGRQPVRKEVVPDWLEKQKEGTAPAPQTEQFDEEFEAERLALMDKLKSKY